MSITISKTSMTEKRRAYQVIVNPVNTVGVTGKGLAAWFAHAYHVATEQYKAMCNRRELMTGHLFIYPTQNEGYPSFIVFFPTKKDWRDGSELVWIDEGCQKLVEFCEKYKIRRCALPMLGCGKKTGGLPKEDVLAIFQNHFTPTKTEFVVCDYDHNPLPL